MELILSLLATSFSPCRVFSSGLWQLVMVSGLCFENSVRLKGKVWLFQSHSCFPGSQVQSCATPLLAARCKVQPRRRKGREEGGLCLLSQPHPPHPVIGGTAWCQFGCAGNHTIVFILLKLHICGDFLLISFFNERRSIYEHNTRVSVRIVAMWIPVGCYMAYVI